MVPSQRVKPHRLLGWNADLPSTRRQLVRVKSGLGPLRVLRIIKGPPHHHGEAETAAYIVSGHVRVHYGKNFEESVEAGPGDYLFVPANTWHIEENPYDETSEQFLARGPDNIVINMEQ